jgi:hypothetical protein
VAAATLSGSSKSVAVFRGCPQGGVMSMGMEYILKAMWMTLVFYWWGNPQIRFWGSCNTIETWCNEFGLSVNPNKTGLFFIHNEMETP